MIRISGLILIITLLISCNSDPTISDIRAILENSQELIVDYRCCDYKKESDIFERKMERFVDRLSDDVLFDYFEKRGIRNKKIIVRILHRNSCIAMRNYRRSMTELSDEQLESTLDYVQRQILNEFHHERY